MSEDIIITKTIHEPKWIRYANYIGRVLCPVAVFFFVLTAICYLPIVDIDPKIMYDLSINFGAIALFPFTIMGIWLSYKKRELASEVEAAYNEVKDDKKQG